MKLAIIGSRGLKGAKVLYVIDAVTSKAKSTVTSVVSGGAVGVDAEAEKWAKANNVTCEVIKPMYGTYGKIAPLKRNETIINICDAVLAVWDGSSRGTKQAVAYAMKQNKPVYVVTLEVKKQDTLF